MNNKSFNIIVVVAIVSIVWAVWLASQSKEVNIGFIRGQELIPDIDTDRMNRIVITKGDKEVILQKVNDGYRVENRDSYPADGGRINNLLSQCMDIRCMREISKSEDSHAELEVDDGKNATLVRFLSGESEIVAVIVGKRGGEGNYVRVKGTPNVYTSEKTVLIDTEPLSFVDKTITKLEKVERVEVTTRGNSPYVIEKKDGKTKTLGIPDGMVVKSSDENQVFSAADALTFGDFQSEASAKDLKFTHKYVVTTAAGEKYTFDLASKKADGDKSDWFAKVQVEYIGPTSLSAEELKKAKDDPELAKRQENIVEAGKNTRVFNDRHRSWVYKLESWGAGNMTKEFSALYEEDKRFLRLEEKDIVSVTVKQGDVSYSVDRGEDGETSLRGVPDGKKQKMFEHQTVFNATTSLDWAERKKPDDAALKDLKFETNYEVLGSDKARYVFEVAKKDDKYYIKASAVFTGDQKSEASAAILAKGAVAKFNEKHKTHVYEVTSAAAANMVKQLDDLVEDDKSLLKIEEDEIASVDVKGPKGAYKIESARPGQVTLQDVPEGKKAEGLPHSEVFAAARTLEWAEKKPADDAALKDLTFDSSYTLTRRDQTRFVFEIATKDDTCYVKARASGSDASVAKFNAMHGPNVYEVPKSSTANMTKVIGDLVIDESARPARIQASHILISFKGGERSEATRSKDEAKKLADEVHKQVMLSPDTFGKIASEKSDGPSKTKGGDLGVFPFEQMAKAFSEAAFKLQPGQISEVVETGFGFHIIMRTK